MEEQTTITRTGQILVWCAQVRDAIQQDTEEPDAGIPFEVCDCPSLSEYKQIIAGAA